MTTSALVFGAGARRGVGGAVCARLARDGMRVFPVGRTPEKLDALCAEIQSEVKHPASGAGGGAHATPIVADCTTAEGVRTAFERVEESAGAPPALVVYNAGNAAVGSLIDMEDDFFEAVWRLCAFGAFLCGREAARRMVPAGGGTLIFTGATSSLRSKPPFIAFAAAKAAERSVAQGLAREFGPQGLHVAHVILDAAIDGAMLNTRMPDLRDRLGEDGMLNPDAIADTYLQLHQQHRSAWTFELDLRPFKETF